MKVEGFCVCCNQSTVFMSENEWLRDYFKCSICGCIPRERAIMRVIELFFPNWRQLSIHESSPGGGGASRRLQSECGNYVPSHYWPEKKLGEIFDGIRNIDLENQSFEDSSFELVVTQDVFEHLYDPEKAAREISRTLKSGGAHVFTVPLMNKNKPSEKWSVIEDGEVVFLKEEEYHSNPIDARSSAVSYHYGYDLGHLMQQWSGMPTTIVYIDDLSLGIRAEYIEVLVSRKK